MNIIIKRMWLDEHEVKVPPGLSELLNRAGAWKLKEDVPNKSAFEGYHREVFKRNGKLVTRYTIKS